VPAGSDGVISIKEGQKKYFLLFGKIFWFGLGVEATDEPPDDVLQVFVEAGLLGSSRPLLHEATFTPADILRWRRIIQAIERKEGPIQHPQCFSEKPNPMRYRDCDYHLAFPRRIGNLQQRNAESHTLDGGLKIFSAFLRAAANFTLLSKMPTQSRFMTALLHSCL